MDALIGSTGFVGQTLLRQRNFAAHYHSTDIDQVEGKKFNTVVCAGVTAVKWWANANAAADLAGIERLIRHLDRVETDRFVLISTIDVYAELHGPGEDDPVPAPGLHPYGLHRAMLEGWVRGRFPRHHIIRLPALFGPGLKKNAVFDLMHDNRLAYIDPASRFQWYPLERLADDIDRVQVAELPLVNLATEPVMMETIRQRLFPTKLLGGQAQAISYDIRTLHGGIFGGDGRYAIAAEDVLTALARFVADPT